MGGKTQINGTLYDISGGKTQIGGTAYSISGGKTQIGGTTYSIGFGTPMNSLSIGSSVYTTVDGVRGEFIIVHKGLPSNVYDDSCNGIWLLANNLQGAFAFNSGSGNNFATSSSYTFLNGTFLNSLPQNVRNAILQAKIPYYPGGSDEFLPDLLSGSDGLSAKVFLPSLEELGFDMEKGGTLQPVTGAKLDYFSLKTNLEDSYTELVVTKDGSPQDWWTRDPLRDFSNMSFLIDKDGSKGSATTDKEKYLRPMFIMPFSTRIDDDMNIV